MGNCLWLLCLDHEIKYNSNGNQYTEYLVKNKNVSDVFKIMVKIYPTYKIVSIENENDKNDEEKNIYSLQQSKEIKQMNDLGIKTKLVNIYFDDATQYATIIEVFD